MAYAVWKNDLYPYRETGKIKNVYNNGTFEIEGYGKMRFRPQKIISDNKGKQLKDLLSELREEKRKAVDKLTVEGKMKIIDLIGI